MPATHLDRPTQVALNDDLKFVDSAYRFDDSTFYSAIVAVAGEPAASALRLLAATTHAEPQIPKLLCIGLIPPKRRLIHVLNALLKARWIETPLFSIIILTRKELISSFRHGVSLFAQERRSPTV